MLNIAATYKIMKEIIDLYVKNKKEILKLHNILQIQLSLSKSIKSSATIVFEINLDS
jgi:hypothetical protein